MAALFFPSYIKWENSEENLFTVYVNGENVGMLAEKGRAEELFLETRKEVAAQYDELVFMEVDLKVDGEVQLWGEVEPEENVKQRMREVIQGSVQETVKLSYIVKVNNSMATLGSKEEVLEFLQTAVDLYDSEDRYQVELVHAEGREFSVLTAQIVDTKGQDETIEEKIYPDTTGGAQKALDDMFDSVEPLIEKGFEDFDLGIKNMNFAEEVEIVEAYTLTSQLNTVEEAINDIIKLQDVPAIYTVKAGDTLYEIAIEVNIPMDEIVAMNDSLASINSIINIGQELIITVPKPELSVQRQEEVYYEEVYDADVIYVDNNSWYTTKTVTLQEPTAGFRKVVARVTYTNDTEVSREIIKEEVVMEAVPKIVERGTKTPPTYIKPINGGRLTSKFGYRDINLAGATKNHQAVDWAIPKGTTVMASSGGTVVRAGWVGSYGYVIYIDHPDGRQTRYAHLSKILVTVGQKVKQGEKIALSGNTGVSSGPHIHFEMWINGKRVDPLKYIE